MDRVSSFAVAVAKEIAAASSETTVEEYESNMKHTMETYISAGRSEPYDPQLHVEPPDQWYRPALDILGHWKRTPSVLYAIGARVLQQITHHLKSITFYGGDSEAIAKGCGEM